MTTIVSVATYWFFDLLIGQGVKINFFSEEKSLGYLISNTISFLFAMTFAYVTNKIWVFESKVKGLKANLIEIVAFLSCRVLTGLMDMAIMYLCVDLLGWNDMIIKLASNVLVVIVNYIGSKLVIFKNKESK